jgi:hypothetical protein
MLVGCLRGCVPKVELGRKVKSNGEQKVKLFRWWIQSVFC